MPPKSSVRVTDTTASPLDEIKSLVRNDLPALADIAVACPQLGAFESAWRWLALAQQKPRPAIQRPRIAVFLCAQENSQDEISRSLAGFQSGSHPAMPLAEEANADLQVYDLGVTASALSEQEAAQAIAYGMMAMQPGIDLLVLCAPAPAAEQAAAKITAALEDGTDPFDALQRCGAADIAAMTGAIIAARLARTPVLLEGTAAETAAAILEKAQTGASAHTRNAASLVAEKTSLAAPCRAALLIPLLKSITRAAG